MTARSLLSGNPASANYSLCHGLAGDAELFLNWAELTGDSEARSLVETVAVRRIQDFAREHRPWPSGIDGAPESPGLMLGLAGTGYFYLRAARPARMPSVLLVGPENKASSAGTAYG